MFTSNLFAIYGDIHANLESLEAILTDAERQGVSQFICTGDIVGYGANPSECLKIIQDLNCPTVLGNHDSYAVCSDGLKDFNTNAMNAILWTRERLDEHEKQWLLSLPLECNVVGGHLVHSSLDEPLKWHYVMSPESAETALRIQKPDVVFFGHTHIPSLFSFCPKTKNFKWEVPLGEGPHFLEPDWKHLLNPGSVGQPRDHDARASYAIYDSVALTFEIRRVEYDVALVQKKIEFAGLPLRNAERLSHGR